MRERNKLVALALIEFILELHPVEPEVMKAALQGIHEHQDG